MLDNDVIAVITSPEALKVSGFISAIYLKLKNAPTQFLEKEGVIHFKGEQTDQDHWVTPWQQLCGFLGVSSATVRKSLEWMRQQGVIGYWASKGGFGIRIFLNRATSSVQRSSNALTVAAVTSDFEVPFNKDKSRLNSRKLYSVTARATDQSSPSSQRLPPQSSGTSSLSPKISAGLTDGNGHSGVPLDQSMHISLHHTAREIERRLESKLASVCAYEFERMREWFDEKGLPKIGRVAQRETYRLLEKNASARDEAERLKRDLSVGAHVSSEDIRNQESSVNSESTTQAAKLKVTSDAEVLWSRVLQELSSELAVGAIASWLEPLRAVDVQAQTLFLRARDHFELEWINAQYRDAINRALPKVGKTVVQVRIMTGDSTEEGT